MLFAQCRTRRGTVGLGQPGYCQIEPLAPHLYYAQGSQQAQSRARADGLLRSRLSQTAHGIIEPCLVVDILGQLDEQIDVHRIGARGHQFQSPAGGVARLAIELEHAVGVGLYRVECGQLLDFGWTVGCAAGQFRLDFFQGPAGITAHLDIDTLDLSIGQAEAVRASQRHESKQRHCQYDANIESTGHGP